MNVMRSNQYLKGIILPSTLREIFDYAFLGCTGLTSIVIPNGLEKIGSSAFSQCSNLVSVSLPMGVLIGENAFPEGINNNGSNTLRVEFEKSSGGPGIYERTPDGNNWKKAG
jgi:hypothetical protein